MLRGRESRETRQGVPRTLWGCEAGSLVEMELNLGVAERRKAVGECAGHPQFFGKTSVWKQVGLNSEVAQKVRTRTAQICVGQGGRYRSLWEGAEFTVG